LLFITIIPLIVNKITAQTISYAIDESKLISIETIDALEFKPYTKTINDGTNYANYWIKIEGLTANQYSIQLPNSRLVKIKAFQKKTSLKQTNVERFATFLVSGPETIIIKVDATKESYIPVTVDLVNDFNRKEKANVLFIGFYIGFVILMFLLNMVYAFYFNDRTYTFYGLFLLSAALGIIISDGVFTFLQFSNKSIDFIETINNIAIGVFAILFITRFSQINDYYPKFRIIPFSVLFLSVIAAVLFLTTDNFLYYIILECLVFLALLTYWLTGLLFFHKTTFIKITVFAYSLILLFSLDFYLTKLFGFTIMQTTAIQLKFGSILEMSILSIVVIYRMKIVHSKNKEMRNAIEIYTTELKILSKEVKKEKTQTIENSNLSFRENEVMELISKGKTNKQIASALNISENTVKYHVKNIYNKLNIKSRKEVIGAIKRD